MISLFESLNINIAGLVNNDIHNKLNPYVPVIDMMLKIWSWFEKLKAIKFQGNPVKIVPLRNSEILNITEKIKNELITFFCSKTLKNKKVMPKNIPRNAGIKRRATGIKNLKFSSNDREIEIQYRLLKK